MSRPLDLLERSKGKRILVHCKNGDDFTGTLEAFDLHLNTWISASERIPNVISNTKIKLGNVLIRGDTIIFMSPDVEGVE